MMFIAVVVGFYVLFAGILFVLQQKMIYPARTYGIPADRLLPKNAATLRFTTSQGPQVSYLLLPANSNAARPRDPARPLTLWVCFHGNASLALDWLDLIESAPDPDAAWLLVEYPGYGENPGTAWAWTIRESGEGALAAALESLRASGELHGGAYRVNVLGYSIGAAAALQFAAQSLSPETPLDRVVLLAPFTRLSEIARRQVGRPLSWLLRDSYDNVARLGEIARRPTPPRVALFHGSADPLIPAAMSQQLAAAHPAITHLTLAPRVDHGWIVDAVRAQLDAELRPRATESAPQTPTAPSPAPAGDHEPR